VSACPAAATKRQSRHAAHGEGFGLPRVWLWRSAGGNPSIRARSEWGARRIGNHENNMVFPLGVEPAGQGAAWLKVAFQGMDWRRVGGSP